MGFWSRLFGERETSAQKIERARFHLDEHEPQLAVRIVEGVSGPEAEEIRRRARDVAEGQDARTSHRPARDIKPGADDIARQDDDPPSTREHHKASRDPYRDPAKPQKPPKPPKPPQARPGELTIQFGSDGSTTFTSGASRIALNVPVSDDDGRARSTDGLTVARRLLANTALALDARSFAFVDAAYALARAGEELPAQGDPQRRAIAALCVAASTGDAERVAAVIRAAAPDVVETLAWFATPLAVRFAAAELGALALQGLVSITRTLIGALIRTDAATCVQLVERAGDPLLGAEASLLADEAGLPARAWYSAPTDPDAWRPLEIRRLARTDLEAALALEEVHAGEVGPDERATYDLARALAAADPARLLAKVRSLDPIVDHAGWLAALARAGVAGTEAIVDTWIDALGPSAYDPYAHFAATLDASIVLGDIDRVRRCMSKGGPTGWQVACASREALARSTRRDVMLATLYERVAPGVVSSRGIPFGAFPFAAGKVVLQPGWLAFTEPQPIETLAIVAVLGPDGPSWPSAWT